METHRERVLWKHVICKHIKNLSQGNTQQCNAQNRKQPPKKTKYMPEKCMHIGFSAAHARQKLITCKKFRKKKKEKCMHIGSSAARARQKLIICTCI